MNEYKFIVEKGTADIKGDTIILSGLMLPTIKVKVYDAGHKVAGYVKVFIEDGLLMAQGYILDGFENHYPSVGYYSIVSKQNKTGGRYILQSRLICIAVSNEPNADPDIKRINEQQKTRMVKTSGFLNL